MNNYSDSKSSASHTISNNDQEVYQHLNVYTNEYINRNISPIAPQMRQNQCIFGINYNNLNKPQEIQVINTSVSQEPKILQPLATLVVSDFKKLQISNPTYCQIDSAQQKPLPQYSFITFEQPRISSPTSNISPHLKLGRSALNIQPFNPIENDQREQQISCLLRTNHSLKVKIENLQCKQYGLQKEIKDMESLLQDFYIITMEQKQILSSLLKVNEISEAMACKRESSVLNHDLETGKHQQRMDLSSQDASRSKLSQEFSILIEKANYMASRMNKFAKIYNCDFSQSFDKISTEPTYHYDIQNSEPKILSHLPKKKSFKINPLPLPFDHEKIDSAKKETLMNDQPIVESLVKIEAEEEQKYPAADQEMIENLLCKEEPPQLSKDEEMESSFESDDESYTTTRYKKVSKKKYVSKRGRKCRKGVKGITKAIKKDKKSKVKAERFVCVKCGEVFQSGWALGGHASRVHPGESLNYRNKVLRRQERTSEREILAIAKQKHAEMYGPNAPINRVKIRKFKKEIKKELEGQKSSNSFSEPSSNSATQF